MPSNPTFAYEKQYWQQDIMLVAGIDEVGMGALAGPVVAAAVIFPTTVHLKDIRDSKTLSAKKREALTVYIKEKAATWGIGEANVEEITALNIREAAHLAMRRAIAQLTVIPEVLLIDGNAIPKDLPAAAEPIIKGDGKSWSIAAASIVAKVHRDAIMTTLDKKFPAFGFASNKGYGSAAHLSALEQFGPSPHHRPTYAPVARQLTDT